MQKKVARRSNPERTEQTRSALVAAARELFTSTSYAETSTPEIARAAGVTRGALYHHFEDKRALFLAVVEEEARAVAAEIEASSPRAKDIRGALVAGTDAYLTAMKVPGRTRLLLIDGPAVLGRAEVDQIDARHASRTLAEGLHAARAEGLLGELSVEAVTALLSAAFDRCALALEEGAALTPYRKALMAIIDGVLLSDKGAKKRR